MQENLVTALIHIAAGLLLSLLGYLVKIKQWSLLISGYNTASAEEKAKYDVEALCSGVGGFLFFLGFTLFVSALGFYLSAGWIQILGWSLFLAATIWFLSYANTGGALQKITPPGNLEGITSYPTANTGRGQACPVPGTRPNPSLYPASEIASAGTRAGQAFRHKEPCRSHCRQYQG